MSSSVSKAKAVSSNSPGASERQSFLDLSGGRILSANPDGSDLKTILSEGRRLPDEIVVGVEAEHLYWTNMGNPSANDGSIERADLDGKNPRKSYRQEARSLPSSSIQWEEERDN